MAPVVEIGESLVKAENIKQVLITKFTDYLKTLNRLPPFHQSLSNL